MLTVLSTQRININIQLSIGYHDRLFDKTHPINDFLWLEIASHHYQITFQCLLKVNSELAVSKDVNSCIVCEQSAVLS